jgi:peptidoglycan/LPS O-acetylase OafA/YrhL
MFLLFFIAGTSTHIALGARGGSEYVAERFKRLFIPLIFFMVALFPLLAFYWPGVIENPTFDAFFAFWPRILLGTLYNPYNGSPNWAHLWFVAYLFIFSLLMLPFFLRWKKRREPAIISKLASFSEKRGGIIIFALPVILIMGLLAPIWPFYRNNLVSDWGYFAYNLTAFIYGYLFMTEERFRTAVDRIFKVSLLLGAVTAGAKIAISLGLPRFTVVDYTPEYLLYSVLNGLNTWFWITGILGLARKTLNFRNTLLTYFSRISYPFYIFHLVVMVVIGWYVTRLNLGFLWEFTLLSGLSLTATLLCCEMVRRIRWISIFFGIKKPSK